MKARKSKPRPILATTSLTADLDEVVASAGRKRSPWKSVALTAKGIGNIPKRAGVYCFVLPRSALPKKRILILYGRTFGRHPKKSQFQIQFRYEAQTFGKRAGFVVYVGKAANLHSRIKLHMSVNSSSTTNQVLRGLSAGSESPPTPGALGKVRSTMIAHATVHYFVHFHADEMHDPRELDNAGECLVAERDLLEIKLIARFAPPFNIKAEH